MDVFLPQPPLVNIDQAALWYGAGGFGSLFGGQNIARAQSQGPDAGYRFTVIPLPVQTPTEVTLPRLTEAVAESVTGRLESMVDVYRLSVERDGWMDSILRTMSHGLLGMPLSFQGDPEICSALLDADGTAGDFFAMHPEAECAKIFSDFIGLGFGLGQYLLMCWRCGGVDWKPEASPLHVETCLRCQARRQDRPYGARELFQLRWRDPRWLWRNPISRQWYYNGTQGQVPFVPGDGEWVLIQSVPDQDIWRNGPWTWGCVAAIMARDARYDAVNTSAVCAPMHLFLAKGPTAQDTRADVDRQAKNIRFGSSVTLPGEWDHRIDAAKAEFTDVMSTIIEDSVGMWEVGITGNRQSMKAGGSFANMDVYERVTEKRRAFYAGAWIRQLMAQGLVWYVRANWGPQAAVPVGVYDVKSPADKLKTVEALGALGDGVAKLVKGLKVGGIRPTLAQLTEICQRAAVRVEEIPGRGPQLFDLDPKDEIAGIKIGEWRIDQGLPLAGDARDDMMMAAGVKPGGPATPVAATPEVAPVPAPGGAPPQAPAAPAAANSPASPPARQEADPEDCDPGEEDCDEDARRADLARGLAGFPQCAHGRAHRCDRCGVQRTYAPPARDADGNAVHPIAWRAIPRKRGAMARLALPDAEAARMLERLDDALVTLEIAEADGAT